MKVKCTICGAIFDDTEEICPICGVSKEFFEPIEEAKEEGNVNDISKIVIIGGGIAAMTTATEIRNKSQTVKIIMIYNEPYLPYQRPLLTKKLYTFNELIVLKDRAYFEKENIELINDNAIRVDYNSKEVYLENEGTISFDKLVIATGSHAFLPDVIGNDLDGVFTLRTISDAKKIINYSNNKNNIIIIGGGVLGLEAAISFVKANKKVTIFENSDRLMKRQLDEKGSKTLLNFLTEKGIDVKLQAKTSKITEGLKVFYNDFEIIDADLVLFSTGIRPNKELLDDFTTNEYLETKYDNIYACGDVISKFGLWPEAIKMAKVVANNIINENNKEIYETIEPYLTTKLDDINVLKIGNEGTSYVDLSINGNYLVYYFINDVICGASLVSKENKLDEVLNNYYKKINKKDL